MGHISDVPDLAAAAQNVTAAVGPAAKWDAFKPAGDIVFHKLIADFPIGHTLSAKWGTQEELDQIHDELTARGDGHIIAGLLQIIQVLMPLIQQFLPMFFAPKT